METVTRSVGARVLDKGRDEQVGKRRCVGQGNCSCMILSWGIHVTIHLSKHIECTVLRESPDPDVGYGLWLIMMYVDVCPTIV